ncbi:glucuronyl/N-acetylglucosaminyl transferase EXT1 [Fistulifera solaris]|uniref:Glucuronyl/N-acetylglucosaminyl transferase EXT1 n=1 Tax=Fistulifera solaris TaxID=1519565 RepID=A0A1Z5KGH0_FISSO|nr:glucuronyl/N-acetylglucosaminyl transferase EXT1 [Fistulifera solaris]|eukprot:GAX25383.1 glucuronyl/N-acetylglucosaminyl transferase EXT1 [Fistulifera solaris]
MEDVVVELHEENTLNERFRVLRPAPTKGILSLDDDILRPCIAYDWAFAKWTQHPSRIVGFDARSHEIASDGRWKYAYMSTTEKTNKYSLTLTRCCFVHVDYLNWYMENPFFAPIRNMVADYNNCEDIALSLLVSSQTDGKPPLLADLWAVKSMIKLDNNQGKISAGKDHKSLRDNCVNTFSQQLGLKNKLAVKKLRHGSLFEYGDAVQWEAATHWNNTSQRIKRWKEDANLLKSELMDLRAGAAVAAYEAGLVEGSDPWQRRFHGLNSSIHN